MEDEKAATVRDGLIQLCVPLCPLDGPPAIIRVDPAPGFNSLRNDSALAAHRLRIEVGEAKNKNKNPVAEKAVQEFEDELLRQDPERTSVTSSQLAVVIAALNARIRNQGLSSREIWTQRDQFSHEQLPMSDEAYIDQQFKNRQRSHNFQPKSFKSDHEILVGDLVYLYSDKNKLNARPRYLVVDVQGYWCFLRKFVGRQLRQNAYKVHRDDVFKVQADKVRESRESKLNRPMSSLLQPVREEPNTHLPPYTPPPIPAEITEPAEDGRRSIAETQVAPVATTEASAGEEGAHAEFIEEEPTNAVPPVIIPSSEHRPARRRRPPTYLADYDRS